MSSEAEAMKQNLNGMLGMLVTIVLGAGYVGLALLFAAFTGGFVTFLLTLFAVSAAAAGSVALLGAVADARYLKLEP
jgi:hypothetical protein